MVPQEGSKSVPEVSPLEQPLANLNAPLNDGLYTLFAREAEPRRLTLSTRPGLVRLHRFSPESHRHAPDTRLPASIAVVSRHKP